MRKDKETGSAYPANMDCQRALLSTTLVRADVVLSGVHPSCLVITDASAFRQAFVEPGHQLRQKSGPEHLPDREDLKHPMPGEIHPKLPDGEVTTDDACQSVEHKVGVDEQPAGRRDDQRWRRAAFGAQP